MLERSQTLWQGITGCAPVSSGKRNTAEMPRELHRWHTGWKFDKEDCVGVRKII